jgi:hypothetical protein
MLGREKQAQQQPQTPPATPPGTPPSARSARRQRSRTGASPIPAPAAAAAVDIVKLQKENQELKRKLEAGSDSAVAVAVSSPTPLSLGQVVENRVASWSWLKELTTAAKALRLPPVSAPTVTIKAKSANDSQAAEAHKLEIAELAKTIEASESYLKMALPDPVRDCAKKHLESLVTKRTKLEATTPTPARATAASATRAAAVAEERIKLQDALKASSDTGRRRRTDFLDQLKLFSSEVAEFMVEAEAMVTAQASAWERRDAETLAAFDAKVPPVEMEVTALPLPVAAPEAAEMLEFNRRVPRYVGPADVPTQACPSGAEQQAYAKALNLLRCWRQGCSALPFTFQQVRDHLALQVDVVLFLAAPLGTLWQELYPTAPTATSIVTQQSGLLVLHALESISESLLELDNDNGEAEATFAKMEEARVKRLRSA